jgi:L-rhamnose isomerase
LRYARWDSDHVVILSDDLQAIMQEIIRGGYLDRTHIGLDYFDASINRVAAWVIGSRNALRALLLALLEPLEQMKALEHSGDFTARLALYEELKGLPFGAIWDYYCAGQSVPGGMRFIDTIQDYEKKVLSQRYK